MATKASKDYKGISRKHQVNAVKRRDDVRKFSEKMQDWASTTGGTLAIFAALLVPCLLMIAVPFVPEIIFCISLHVLFRYYRFKKRRWRLPFRVPAYLSVWMKKPVLDSTTGKAGQANLYLGKDNETGDETWANTSDVNKHVLIFGTTGSGKTEAIMGNVLGFLALGSGVMVVDGKASANTFDSVYTLMRILGRDADLFVIDYLTGGKDMAGPQQDRRSHTYNPLAFGGATQKAEIMVSLMDTEGGDKMWSGRAISFIESVIPPLSFLAERGHALLNPSMLAEYFSLEVLENMVSFGIIVDLNDNVIDMKTQYPAEWRELDKRMSALKLYLFQLPGWESGRSLTPHLTSKMQAPGKLETNKKIVEKISERAKAAAADLGLKEGDKASRGDMDKQHGYITMQLVRAVANLSENYGFIYNAEISEISFWDVVLNRRGLVVLLPAMERSPENLEQLGKMTVLAFKSVLGALINTRPEGTRREIIEGNPSNSEIPYQAVLDEVGAYMVKGVAVIPAQARSLGISVWFGTQTYADLMKADQNEGKAIVENTAMKMFGRLAGAADSETAKLAMELGGKAHVQMAEDMTYKSGAVIIDSGLKSTTRSQLREDYRVDFEDLAQQENGEFHMMIGAKEIDQNDVEKGGVRLVRLLAFFTGNVDRIDVWKRNAYCVVKPPSRADAVLMGRSEQVRKRIRQALDDVQSDPRGDVFLGEQIGNIRAKLQELERGTLGLFLAWRRERIESGEWEGLSRAARDDAIRAWWINYAATTAADTDKVGQVEKMDRAAEQVRRLTKSASDTVQAMFDDLEGSWSNRRIDEMLVKIADSDLADYPQLRQSASPRLLSRRALLEQARDEGRVTPAEAAAPSIREAVAEAEKLLERA